MVPKLSVVVPVYNVEQYIGACLESLANQTMSDLEVLVIDDGSPDRAGAVADAFAARDPRFRVFHVPNGGVSRARNLGIAEARGEYLAFVDPDDLIPPRAYELMLATLEQTGSDFVAGNAWRFAEGIGTVQSWTHRQAFWRDRPQTHISELNQLLGDRMMWNKVYRRDFWDRHGLSFPIMKYEDFPVALKAHLVAESVDVLSAKVYMWRNRESGDSITQQLSDPSNARDRVVSAEMILDLLREHRADRKLSAAMQAYLIDVDIVALATALVTGEKSDQPELEQLALRLSRALAPQRKGTTRLARLIHEAMREGDFDTVRVLVGWRISPNRRRLFSEVTRHGSVRMLPRVAKAVMPRRRRGKFFTRKLRSTLVEVSRSELNFDVQSHSLLSASMLRKATVEAYLVGPDTTMRLASKSTPVADGFKLFTRVPADATYALGTSNGRLEIRVKSGLFTWKGSVPAPTNMLPGAVELTAGRWVVPTAYQGVLGVMAQSLPVVADIEILPTSIRFSLPHAHRGSVVVARPEPTPDLFIPVVDGVAEVSFEELAQGDPTDNPFSGVVHRWISVLDEGLPAEPEHYRRLYAHDWPDSVERGEYRFDVHADMAGAAQLVRTYLPAAEAATYVHEDLSL